MMRCSGRRSVRASVSREHVKRVDLPMRRPMTIFCDPIPSFVGRSDTDERCLISFEGSGAVLLEETNLGFVSHKVESTTVSSRHNMITTSRTDEQPFLRRIRIPRRSRRPDLPRFGGRTSGRGSASFQFERRKSCGWIFPP